MKRRTTSLTVGLLALMSAAVLAARAEEAPATSTPAHRIYTQLMDPRQNPDYARHSVKPPNWETFGKQTQFTSLRGFGVEKGKLVNFISELDKYTKTHDLGSVIWPSYDCIFADNLGELADEVKKRGLFLFDIWGYVPGSGPGGYWQQFKPPAGVFELLESKLGDHWLGMDVGEQDGRYIGGYAGQMYPVSTDRFEQYLNFHRHFEKMCDELGNKMSALVSLNFGHYFLKAGIYTGIGAETAQGLPNGQVYYSFIRGAGKQYGVPWFGNASVWNRWGWKTYEGTPGPDHGPTKGTSLNLLKRLMYNHILYNCMFVGFESSWFEGDKLSPVGKIQQEAQKWVRTHGQPGVMMTPVALLVDFNAGWTFPRHLYTENIYRVWGNLPYEAGDYFTDAVLDMLYPGYQDSSFYHNESGFMAPTPYGDVADCLLSDATASVLAQYPLIVVAGELRGGAELRDKLNAYVEGGGRLIITGRNLAKFDGGIAGVTATGPASLKGGATMVYRDKTMIEDVNLDVYGLNVPTGAKVLAHCDGLPGAIVEASAGKGSLVAVAAAFGLGAAPRKDKLESGVDRPLDKPYALLKHVRALLDDEFRAQALFDAGEGLSLVTCRKAPGEYTLCVSNNALQPRPFTITSRCGAIESVTELPLDQSDKGAQGYLPEGTEPASVGSSSATVIAGGDVRVFAVKAHETNVTEIAPVIEAKRSTGRALPLRSQRSIQEEILARPTFFEHFDSVVVDWRYLNDRDIEALRGEAGWLKRQGVRIYIDLTSGLNIFPDLRLLKNDDVEYAKSMKTIERLLEKMTALQAKDLILSLHQDPENNFTREQSQASFTDTLKTICAKAATTQATVYLRTGPKAPGKLAAAIATIDAVGATNLKLAVSVAQLVKAKTDPKEIEQQLRGKVGLWLASLPYSDATGNNWTLTQALHGRDNGSALAYMAAAKDVPILLDAVYPSGDDEYRDVKVLEQLASR